jgi:hypothetical protein
VVSEPDTGWDLLVHQEHPVGVAVEGQPDVGAGGSSTARLQGHQVLGLDGVGRMVGEVAVQLGEEDLHLGTGVPRTPSGTTRPPMPLAVSATTRSGRRVVDVHERADVVGVGSSRTDRASMGASAARRSSSGGPPVTPLVEQRLGGGLDLGQAGVASDRAGAGQAELEAVVLRRIVRGGEHGTGGVEAAGGEVEQVGGGEAEVDHRGSLRPDAVGEGGGQLDPRFAHVPGHQHGRGPGEPGHGHADGPELLGVELIGDHSPDVVGLENVGEPGHGRAILARHLVGPGRSVVGQFEFKPTHYRKVTETSRSPCGRIGSCRHRSETPAPGSDHPDDRGRAAGRDPPHSRHVGIGSAAAPGAGGGRCGPRGQRPLD